MQALKNIVRILKYHGLSGLIYRLKKRFQDGSARSAEEYAYIQTELPRARSEYEKKIEAFKKKPLVSLIMPVCDPPIQFLEEALQSVASQAYSNWELCIADDASKMPEVKECLSKWSSKDRRIKVVYRGERGHIAEASQSALELVTGEYVGLLDHDDLLPLHALFHVVENLQAEIAPDVLYSDEAKIDEEGNLFSPHLKPKWSPMYFRSFMYVGHFTVYRTGRVRNVGGFRREYNGSQDYDLLLRVSEETNNIVHIPKILYYWRSHSGSVASGATVKSYAIENGLKALKAGMERVDSRASSGVRHGPYPGTYEYYSPQSSADYLFWSESETVDQFHLKLEKSLTSKPSYILFLEKSLAKPSERELKKLLGPLTFPFVGATSPLFISSKDEHDGYSLYEGGPGHRFYVAHEVEELNLRSLLVSFDILVKFCAQNDYRVGIGEFQEKFIRFIKESGGGLVVVPQVRVLSE